MKTPLFPWSGKEQSKLPFHPPNTNIVGAWLVATALVERSIKRAFAGVYIYVEPVALAASRSGVPLIFCVTHSGWYDGYMTYVINKVIFRRAGYLMMEEANLKRYPFLSWVGVFGVDRDDARKALQSIDYISARIRRERAALWMFPQGTITHPDARPLRLFGGVANSAKRLGECALVPVAIRYEFGLEQSAEVYVRIGEPLLLRPRDGQLSTKEITAEVVKAMTETSDRLHEDIMSINRPQYRKVMGGRGSVNKVWDALLGAVGKLRPHAKG